MRKILFTVNVYVPLMMTLVLASCGYHLAGHGEGGGAIPEDVHTLSIQAASGSKAFLPLLRQRIQSDPHAYTLVDGQPDKGSSTHHAVLRITHVAEKFAPVAYDAAGIAIQYRLTLKGGLAVYHQGKVIWQSGAVSVKGDVFATGGPASIEASRQRLADDLRKEWMRNVWTRLRAGF
ncbi:MAG: adenosylmethionine-8-amino-7-oxononanoate aminotransferase [Mariprofundaceae bacterium]